MSDQSQAEQIIGQGPEQVIAKPVAEEVRQPRQPETLIRRTAIFREIADQGKRAILDMETSRRASDRAPEDKTLTIQIFEKVVSRIGYRDIDQIDDQSIQEIITEVVGKLPGARQKMILSRLRELGERVVPRKQAQKDDPARTETERLMTILEQESLTAVLTARIKDLPKEFTDDLREDNIGHELQQRYITSGESVRRIESELIAIEDRLTQLRQDFMARFGNGSVSVSSYREWYRVYQHQRNLEQRVAKIKEDLEYKKRNFRTDVEDTVEQAAFLLINQEIEDETKVDPALVTDSTKDLLDRVLDRDLRCYYFGGREVSPSELAQKKAELCNSYHFDQPDLIAQELQILETKGLGERLRTGFGLTHEAFLRDIGYGDDQVTKRTRDFSYNSLSDSHRAKFPTGGLGYDQLGTEEIIARQVFETEQQDDSLYRGIRWYALRTNAVIYGEYSPEFIEDIDRRVFRLAEDLALTKFKDQDIEMLGYFDHPESIKDLILLMMGSNINYSHSHACSALSHHLSRGKDIIGKFITAYAQVQGIEQFGQILDVSSSDHSLTTEAIRLSGDFLAHIATDQEEDSRLRRLAMEGLRDYRIEGLATTGRFMLVQYEMSDDIEVKLGILSTLEYKAQEDNKEAREVILKIYDEEKNPSLRLVIAHSISNIAQTIKRKEGYTYEKKDESGAWFCEETIQRFTRDLDTFLVDKTNPFEGIKMAYFYIRTLNYLGITSSRGPQIIAEFLSKAIPPESSYGGGYLRDEDREKAETYIEIISITKRSIVKQMNYEQITIFLSAVKEHSPFSSSYDLNEIFINLLPRLYELSKSGEVVPPQLSIELLSLMRQAYKEPEDIPEEVRTSFPKALSDLLEILYKDNLAEFNEYEIPLLIKSHAFLRHLINEPEQAIATISVLHETVGGNLDEISIIDSALTAIYQNSRNRTVKISAIQEMRSNVLKAISYHPESKTRIIEDLLNFQKIETDEEVRGIMLDNLITLDRELSEIKIATETSQERQTYYRKTLQQLIRQRLMEELDTYSTRIESNPLMVCGATLSIFAHLKSSELIDSTRNNVLFEILDRVLVIEETPENKGYLATLRTQLKETIKKFGFETHLEQDKLIRIVNFFELIKTPPQEMHELFCQIEPLINEILQKGEHLGRELLDPFLRAFRSDDPILPPERRVQIEEATFERFSSAIERLVKVINEGELQEFRVEFLTREVLWYLARQPEKVDQLLELPQKAPLLFKYITDGPLKNTRSAVLRYIFGNGDLIRRARIFEAAFSQKVPYWVQLFLFTESVIGTDLANATTAYPIKEIPKVHLEKGVPTFETDVVGIREVDILQHHDITEKPIAQMSVREKRALVVDGFSELDDGAVEGITEIPFHRLHGSIKKMIWVDRLRQTIELSRDDRAKVLADQRNRQVTSNLTLSSGTYIHGAPVYAAGGNVLDYILISGNLPTEALGDKTGKDSYPFQVDFSVMTPAFLEGSSSVTKSITKSISNTYGSTGDYGQNGQMWLVYQRSENCFDQGIAYHTETIEHGLVFGGMPSTEISALVLRNPNFPLRQGTMLDSVEKSIIENGFYIPIYDLEGKLIFSVEDYDRMANERNMRIPINIIDYATKTGEQLGSNPGGSYLLATDSGQHQYYIKYAREGLSPWQGQDRIWSEYLADSIYREAGIAVPESEIVRIRELNQDGHASKWLEGEADPSIARDGNYADGYIIDCWLANWDVQHDQNLRSIGGIVYRLDNGGSLLYRAQGTRKTNFDEIVTELETMRSSYRGLTPERIREQVSRMTTVFTDEKIQQLVNTTRLPIADKEYLIRTLIARRNYISSQFSTESERIISVTPERGAVIVRKISDLTASQEELTQEIAEMGRIFGEEGYQHNGDHLGGHIRTVVSSLIAFPEFTSLDEHSRDLAVIAAFFHDFGKPTGARGQAVERDFDHETPSAAAAASYMKVWGFSDRDIATVVRIINNDGVVSDIVRDKVRDEGKRYTEEQFAELIGDINTLRILRLINRADIIGTVGIAGYDGISQKYEAFFDQAEKFLQ